MKHNQVLPFPTSILVACSVDEIKKIKWKLFISFEGVHLVILRDATINSGGRFLTGEGEGMGGGGSNDRWNQTSVQISYNIRWAIHLYMRTK